MCEACSGLKQDHIQGGGEEILASRLRALENYQVKKQAADEEPQLIFVNASVLTMEPQQRSRAEAVAITGNRISAVGSSSELRQLSGKTTRVIDLEGRTLIPGLNDSHLHQLRAAKDIDNVSLLEARNLQQVVTLIRERAANTSPGQWIESRSLWHESLLAEKRLPTRTELDPATPNHPVFLARGGHVAVANSRALELAGITRHTPDPEGGTIVRDADGEPTGVLLERARDLLAPVLTARPEGPSLQNALRRQMAELNSYGITSVTDPGLSIEDIGTYLDLFEQHGLTVRSHLLQRVYDWESVQASTDSLRPRTGNSFLRFDGFKFSLDGGIEGAALQDPYQVVPGEQPLAKYCGEILLPPGGASELLKMYISAAVAGFQFQTHAVGDAGARILADLYQETNDHVPLEALRWAAVHLSLPHGNVLKTLADLGVVATVQDNQVLLGPNQVKWWGHHRANQANPIRQILEAGIRTGGGTDAPVVPCNPFTSMGWMVTRRGLQGEVLGQDQAISGYEALNLYTYGSAVTQFADQSLGSVRAGKLADLAVLTDDPSTMDPNNIKDLRCDYTVVGGEIVYQR